MSSLSYFFKTLTEIRAVHKDYTRARDLIPGLAHEIDVVKSRCDRSTEMLQRYRLKGSSYEAVKYATYELELISLTEVKRTAEERMDECLEQIKSLQKHYAEVTGGTMNININNLEKRLDDM